MLYDFWCDVQYGDTRKTSVLLESCIYGQLEVVQWLVSVGADPTYCNTVSALKRLPFLWSRAWILWLSCCFRVNTARRGFSVARVYVWRV